MWPSRLRTRWPRWSLAGVLTVVPVTRSVRMHSSGPEASAVQGGTGRIGGSGRRRDERRSRCPWWSPPLLPRSRLFPVDRTAPGGIGPVSGSVCPVDLAGIKLPGGHVQRGRIVTSRPIGLEASAGDQAGTDLPPRGTGGNGGGHRRRDRQVHPRFSDTRRSK